MLAACSVPSLPTMPVADDNPPGSLHWVSLTTAVGEVAIEPSAVVAGQALRLTLEVRSRAGSPMPSIETVFSVQTENFADLVRFPEGDRCLSTSNGHCSVVLVSRGGAGSFDLTARIGAEEPVVET
jgi:hypothetical protein